MNEDKNKDKDEDKDEDKEGTEKEIKETKEGLIVLISFSSFYFI